MKKSQYLLTATLLLAAFPSIAADTIKGKNYQSPSCGCCKDWVKHMNSNGFEIEMNMANNLHPIKQANGIQPEYASCHTAIIQGYVFEGHVPAQDVQRFLKEKPANLKGLAVAGMPMGSPGMEYNDQKMPYDVVAFDEEGNTIVWASHNQAQTQ
ncbi:DUF411 domain-containing protein [Photobacterium sp. 2_MG-2023]|uniref:DUF411 domain-containing protein n=1 Tax=Photobacterium TaxID=657 RepID=UPI001C471F17|nr:MULTISPECIES: DUF411 domain-containing protein [Photobacterium]MBV7262371.1 DUF411 domain-containing protein [Photobacterium sp. WH24]MDO6580537.1 DUF411 domain-containing protein [Photobacterium sp. 2_MG-2023]